ncbi:ADP-ribosylation [Peniophora sp. CONT]|nr:ADP-ribosylation [Peniophora sp. CONT]
MPPLKPAGSIIDLTLDDLDNTRATAKIYTKPLTADSSIEVLEVMPEAFNKPRSKKRARTPSLHEPNASPGKRRKAEPGRQAVAPSTSVIELLDDDEPASSSSKMHNAVASSSRLRPTSPKPATIEQLTLSSHHAPTNTLDYIPVPVSGDEELARRLAEEEAAAHAADEELARRIMEEEQRQYLESLPKNPHDEALARRLYEQEQREQERLMKAIDSKQEGIVYRVSVNIADGTLEDGSPANPDDLARFEPWRQKLENSGIRVKRFHWIVNYELEKKFEAARETLATVMGEAPQEQHLFHGTRQANIDSILNTGFRIGGTAGQKVVNGTALGIGVYLAASATTSIQYAPDADRIFACRVLPGRTTPNMMRDVPPSTIPGQEMFESYCGDAGFGTDIYVVRYSCLVLPCYMIEFERPGYGAGYSGRVLGLGMTAQARSALLARARVGGPPPAGVPLYPPGYALPPMVPRAAPGPRSRKGKGRLR